tara:strand:- start:7630 stop:8412 length:783 start_codon:yes stop_codon:yes gene_type:complete
MIIWDVSPEIFSIGPFAVRWYGLLFASSFFIGFLIIQWVFKQENKPEKDLDELLFYMIIGTLLGARLGHCIFYDPVYYFSSPVRILKVWEGGLASHGGAIGIFFALYIYARRKPDQEYLWLLDRMAIVVALGGFFIRLGNLFNSEIVGKPASIAWAFIFTRVDMIPRHPTQLYEASAYLIIFIMLIKIYLIKRNKITPGLLIGTFFVNVFTFRFFVEFLKENQSGFEASMPINMGQILSIPLILAGIVMLVRLKTNKPLL